jgi:hypothetical protein
VPVKRGAAGASSAASRRAIGHILDIHSLSRAILSRTAKGGNMINPVLFAKTTFQAFEDAHEFMQDYMRPPNPVISYPFLGWAPWAAFFVKMLTQVTVQNLSRLPAQGYGSWLLLLPQPTIAVSADQTDFWFKNPPGWGPPVPPSTQVARTVLHELGHMKMQPYLLADQRNVQHFAPTANPKDEEQAWIYAATVITIFMGDYARHKRITEGIDDTCAVAI